MYLKDGTMLSQSHASKPNFGKHSNIRTKDRGKKQRLSSKMPLRIFHAKIVDVNHSSVRMSEDGYLLQTITEEGF